MKKLFLFLLCALIIETHAVEIGRWGMTVQGAYSAPVGSLQNWFKPSGNYSIKFGQQYDDRWFLSALLEYSRWVDENLHGYPKGRLELSLEHTAVMFDGRYRLLRSPGLQPFIHFGVGILYWRGVRGEIQADDAIGLPHIDEKKLQEYNWCFRSGVGVEVFILSNLSLQGSATYRFVVGDLYPTMERHIELEGVSGFQTINGIVGVSFYF